MRHVLAVVLGMLLVGIALAFISACDTRHVIEVCIPYDSVTFSDSTVVVHRSAC